MLSKMSIVSESLKENLIDLNCSAISVEELFKEKAKVLLKMGYVTDTYEEALLQREKEYPTGLKMPSIDIAIPHTTTEHINEPFIYFNRLNIKGMEFIQMGTDDVVVKPECVLMLGITKPEEQITLLAELMDLFNNSDFINSILLAKTPKEILNIFKNIK